MKNEKRGMRKKKAKEKEGGGRGDMQAPFCC